MKSRLMGVDERDADNNDLALTNAIELEEWDDAETTADIELLLAPMHPRHSWQAD